MRFPYLPNFSYDFCMKTSTFDDPARYPKFQIHFPSLSTLRCWNGRPCVRVLGFFPARHRGEDDRNCQPSHDLHIQVREEVGKIRLRSVGCNILQQNSMLEYWAKFHAHCSADSLSLKVSANCSGCWALLSTTWGNSSSFINGSIVWRPSPSKCVFYTKTRAPGYPKIW